jgi:multiple RNA-binding domain-containing protein 1
MESSRIIVKGLPPSLTEEKLKKHFASQGTITDTRLQTRSRLGFVGYTSAEEAAKAVKYFNRTYIGLSKINVEIARSVRFPRNIVRPWLIESLQVEEMKGEIKPFSKATNSNSIPVIPKSRTSATVHEDVSMTAENPLKRKRKEKEAPKENDTKLDEFLEVMQPKIKTKSWANDDGALVAVDELSKDAAIVEKRGASEDEYEAVPKKVKKNSKLQTTDNAEAIPATADIGNDDKKSSHKVVDDHVEPLEDSSASKAVSDDEWLRKRTNRVLELDEDAYLTQNSRKENDDEEVAAKELDIGADDKEANSGAENASPQDEQSEEEQHNGDVTKVNPDDTAVLAIRATGRLFLRNLSYLIGEDDLRVAFANFGELQEVSWHSRFHLFWCYQNFLTQ